MGSRASKQTSEQKQQLQKAQDKLINERIVSVQTIRQKINHLSSSALVLHDTKQHIVNSFHKFIDSTLNIVEQQLLRKKKPLIKADLIAIIIALRPTYAQYIDDLQTNFTVEDLNLFIRSIVYDPNFFMEQQVQLSEFLQKENSNQLIQQQYQLIEQIQNK